MNCCKPQNLQQFFFVYKRKAKIICIINYGFHLQGFRTYYIIRGKIYLNKINPKKGELMWLMKYLEATG